MFSGGFSNLQQGGSGGSGDVVGPASSTDNAITRFDGTTGKLVQDSGANIDDTGNITANNLSGTNTGDVTLAGTPDYLTISGQTITRNAIDLSTDVTGNLPVSNLGGGFGATSSTFWRGDGVWIAPDFVSGPASSIDNAIPRFHLISGDVIQSSGVTIDDSNNLANVGTINGNPVATGTNTGDVTVLDSSEIDFTLTGQQITASLIAGSIDETKLDTSVNASLDLADSSLQSSDIGTSIQAFDNDLSDIASLTHTKGNIMVSNGTDWINVGVGTNDQVLTADSTQTAGVKWADASGGGGGGGAILSGVIAGTQVTGVVMTIPVNQTISPTTFRTSLEVLPSGATLIVNLYKNATLEATCTHTAGDSATNGLYQQTDTTFVSGSYVAGDVLSVEVSQIGTTIAGSDLTFNLT